LAAVQDQDRQQGALLRPSQAQRPSPVDDLERTEYPKLQHPGLRGRRGEPTTGSGEARFFRPQRVLTGSSRRLTDGRQARGTRSRWAIDEQEAQDMTVKHHRQLPVTAALVIAALAAPAASAQPPRGTEVAL